MVLTSSMENYLKAVFTLRQTHGRVRCIHIAERMDVTLPSVSRAVKELEKMGHVSRDEDGSVTLTPSGERIAAEIYERHRRNFNCPGWGGTRPCLPYGTWGQ